MDALLGRPSLLWDSPDGRGWRAFPFGSANDVDDRRDEGEDGETTHCALAGGDWLAAPNANMGAKPSFPFPDNGGIGYPRLLLRDPRPLLETRSGSSLGEDDAESVTHKNDDGVETGQPGLTP